MMKNLETGHEAGGQAGTKSTQRLAMMFAALSANIEAVLRSTNAEDLYHRVPKAAFEVGKSLASAVLLIEPGTSCLKLVSGFGKLDALLTKEKLSVNADDPNGRGVWGVAFRTGQVCLGAGTSNEVDLEVISNGSSKNNFLVPAALPLVTDRKSIGVFMFLIPRSWAHDQEFIAMSERVADSLSFALDNFARDDSRKRAEARIEYLATHDELTGLPNRPKISQLLKASIEKSKYDNSDFALLFIDLDRFKIVNDSLGHEAGDHLLVEIGKRLRECLPEGDVAGRLGGDEFVAIVRCVSPNSVEDVAQNLLVALRQPMQLCGHECYTTASIGISIFPKDGSDAATLMKNADKAMYLAKQGGKNAFCLFAEETKPQSLERVMFETNLRRALQRDELVLLYQPKVDLTSGEIRGVEALLRWNHPDHGLLHPAQFILLAEETGLIVPIGKWVLREACSQNMRWQQLGGGPLAMAVNLSPRQFFDERLLQDIDEALKTSGMAAALLQIEITEAAVMQNVPRAIKLLNEVKRRGIRVAIDDFGAGYSSMSLMKQFPIDIIKIDQSYMRDLKRDPGDQAIADAIICMGRALGLTVVAEGVETVDQQAFLRDHACNEMQGFLFSRPLPASQILDFLLPTMDAAPPLQPDEVGLEAVHKV